jgi:hypothetical protein
MKFNNAKHATGMSNSPRLCMKCTREMLLVDCLPAYVGSNSSVYKCSACPHTEKVITVSRAWLLTCSNREPDYPFL